MHICSEETISRGNVWCLQVNSDIQLKAMVVADLHLTGPRSAWFDRVSREFFMEFFFNVVFTFYFGLFDVYICIL
jgi:hypothetical protein